MEARGFTVDAPTVTLDGQEYYKGLGFLPEARAVFLKEIRRSLERL